MLATLVGLGTWQVYRLNWKETVLAQIATAEKSPAIPLTGTPSAYQKISVTGRFRFDLASRLGSEVRDMPSGTAIGFHQLVPLERDGLPPVIVDRGWLPDKNGTPVDDPANQVTVVGYVRFGEKANWFSATDDPVSRVFYTPDPGAIGRAVGIDDALPFLVVALEPEGTDTYPSAAHHLPQPPNNHLAYVITWYGLAVALVFIFGAWMRKALRPKI
jgi:surfeit locus 1 family protein